MRMQKSMHMHIEDIVQINIDIIELSRMNP